MIAIRFPAFRKDWAATFHRYYYDGGDGGVEYPWYVGHFEFVRNVFVEANGCEVEFYDPQNETLKGHPVVYVNGAKCVFDIHDEDRLPSYTSAPSYAEKRPSNYLDGVEAVFYLYSNSHAARQSRGQSPIPAYPFSPSSFAHWRWYHEVVDQDVHPCSDLVFAHSAATARRAPIAKHIRSVAARRGWQLDDRVTPQLELLRRGKGAVASVVIPGLHAGICDKTFMQVGSVGGCVISGTITNEFAWHRTLVPGEHYVACDDAFSDFERQAAWCLENRQAARAIGENMKTFFAENCTPDRLLAWVLECLGKNELAR